MALNEKWINFLMKLLVKKTVLQDIINIIIFLGTAISISAFIAVIVGFFGFLVTIFFPQFFSGYYHYSLILATFAGPILFWYVLLKPFMEAKRRIKRGVK